MVTPPSPQNENINKRLNTLKFRLSKKRTDAGVLFNDIVSENFSHYRIKKRFESILNIFEEENGCENNQIANKI